MKKFGLFALALTLGCLALPHRSPAPLVIHPGEDATYVPPGGEEIPNQKDAQAQFDLALEKEKNGKIGAAIAGYKKTVRRFPKSGVAASAQYKIGELSEKSKDEVGAADGYARTIINYPHSTDFNAALEGEFRIGNQYLEGLRAKVLGVPTLPSRERAIAVFKIITQNAPFSRLAPQAQFDIGQCFQIMGEMKDAIDSYQTVVDKYPTSPVAADALYQTGFAYLTVSRSGSNDRTAAQHARESFEDFLAAYPNHEKAAQAKEDLATLGNTQTGGSLKIADYYYGQKMFRAAVVYYNDVIRQQPNSPDGEKAKARLDQIRAKFGEKYFTDTPTSTAANKPAGVNPKLGDGRLQAQTDTAKRPDYVGPPVSAPTPPPTPGTAGNPAAGTASGGSPNLNLPGPAAAPGELPPASGALPSGTPVRGDVPPPPVPANEQPSLPAQ